MAQQLGNMYLLMCFVGLAVLTTTSEIKVVRSYLFALWLGDIGHLAFTCLALGKERSMQPLAWNAMTWGNVGFTVSLGPSLLLPLDAFVHAAGREGVRGEEALQQHTSV